VGAAFPLSSCVQRRKIAVFALCRVGRLRHGRGIDRVGHRLHEGLRVEKLFMPLLLFRIQRRLLSIRRLCVCVCACVEGVHSALVPRALVHACDFPRPSHTPLFTMIPGPGRMEREQRSRARGGRISHLIRRRHSKELCVQLAASDSHTVAAHEKCVRFQLREAALVPTLVLVLRFGALLNSMRGFFESKKTF